MVLSSALPSNTAPVRTSSRRRSFSGSSPGHIAGDADVAEMIERAFIDREGQRKSLGRGIVFGVGVGHAGVGIALAAIIQPQSARDRRDAVGIVDVAAGQEAQHRGRRGLDHGAELPLAERLVADKVDLPHRGLGAFGHVIDEIDAVVAAVDDFGHDADIVAPGMPVGFHDAADVGLHHGALQRAARPWTRRRPRDPRP